MGWGWRRAESREIGDGKMPVELEGGEQGEEEGEEGRRMDVGQDTCLDTGQRRARKESLGEKTCLLHA